MKSLFYKYERTLKNQNILNKNTKNVVLEYLRCDKCKKIPFIEILDIECLNCFKVARRSDTSAPGKPGAERVRNRYKMTRTINQQYTNDEERKSVFETMNTVKKMMLSAIHKKESLSDYIECINALELTDEFHDDMIIFWAKSIMSHIRETNKIPIGDEIENIIYSW